MGGTVRVWSVSLLVAGLAGCATAPAPIGSYEGLQFGIENFYNRYAMEENATCTSPMLMAITSATVVEDTPQKLVLLLRYKYRDEGHTRTTGSGQATAMGRHCNDFADRTFTMDRMTDGSVVVVAMGGEQRSPG